MPALDLNGARYHVENWPGAAGSPMIVALHGFTGNGATWQPVAERLRGRCTVVAPDALGHGQSAVPSDPARYDSAHVAADLAALLDQFGIDRAIVMGYSMGGRMALGFAAAHPDRVQHLLLVSASPGLQDAAEREARIAADNALADRIERDGIAAFVDRWEQLPLWASQRSLSATTREAQRQQRLNNSAAGLAASLRGAGTGAQPSLWDALATIAVPATIIAGALDPKFTAIAHGMADRLPQARVTIVPDAGHNVVLEQPGPVVAALDRIVMRTP